MMMTTMKKKTAATDQTIPVSQKDTENRLQRFQKTSKSTSNHLTKNQLEDHQTATTTMKMTMNPTPAMMMTVKT